MASGAEAVEVNSSDRPRGDPMRCPRIPERVSLLGVDADLVQEVDPLLVGLAAAQAMSDRSSPIVMEVYSELDGSQPAEVIEMVG